MKHPFRFIATLVVVLAALTTIALMAVRYMDVLQEQFELFRDMISRRRRPRFCDDDYCEELEDDGEDEKPTSPLDELKF